MIKGILIDYGGTIDTNGLHWGFVLWNSYQKHQPNIEKEIFSKAYSWAERALALNPIIRPIHTFFDVLRLKVEQQFLFLKKANQEVDDVNIERIAADCTQFAKDTIQHNIPVLAELVNKYPIVLVSNFYGNINSVLSDFGLTPYFKTVIESAVVGVRKPNPEIYKMGMDYLQLPANECVVVGDSYTKDILPAKQLGCKTIWINVQGWEDAPTTLAADAMITDFAQIPNQLEVLNSP
ncbi:MAG: HAD family hydrolase [Siphonobacter sp.]